MPLDPAIIDRIVLGVMQGLRPSPGDRIAAPPQVNPGVDQPSPADGAGKDIQLRGGVITAAVILEHLPSPGSRLTIPPRAIVTPAALDVVRSRRLRLNRESPPAAPVPTSSFKGLAIVVRSTPVLDRQLGESKSAWRRELLGCPDDAATLAISAICRGDADRVMILTREGHRAACRANRNDRVRAAAIRDLADLHNAAGQMRLNVVCLNPDDRGDFELRRLLKAAAAPWGR